MNNKFIKKLISFILCLLIISICFALSAFAASDVTVTGDPDTLIGNLGKGLNTKNPKVTGNSGQIGVFSGADDVFGFDSGIVLSTGSVENVFLQKGASAQYGEEGLEELSAINGGYPTEDAIIFEFDITSPTDKVSFQYFFASNEWDQPVNYNDVFALFVNGKNYALIPDSSTAVNIQSVLSASGFKGGSTPDTGGYFVNTHDIADFGFEGRTVLFGCEATVTPGKVNHIRIALADTSDGSVDSAVFLKGGSLSYYSTESQSTVTKLYAAPENRQEYGKKVEFKATVKNTGDNNDTAQMPSGTVQFSTGKGNLGAPVKLVSIDGVMTAILSVSDLEIGDYTVTATFIPTTGTTHSPSSDNIPYSITPLNDNPKTGGREPDGITALFMLAAAALLYNIKIKPRNA